MELVYLQNHSPQHASREEVTYSVRFEFLTTLSVEITLCILVARCRRFGGTCCKHLAGSLKLELTVFPKTLV
jgi:hypothetical protein